MAFRFDMRDKTPQQQIIVSKRDDENKRKIQEAKKDILVSDNSHIPSPSTDTDKNICMSPNVDFRDFLHSVKNLSDKGINSRLTRLKWVEDACGQSASFLTSNIQTMYNSRSVIYQKANSPHMAGNYYNALMLYYEYVHETKCPRINNKSPK